MKKIQFFQKPIALFLILIMLSSCTVGKSVTATAKTLDIVGSGVIHKPTIVDLDVKETKTTGTSTAETTEKPLDVIKHEAVVNALKILNADVLVEPKFETEVYKGSTTVSVSGFPATYKNFRPIKAEDIPLLQTGNTQKAMVYEPPVLQKKNKNAGWIALGVVVGALAITYAIVSPSLQE